MTKYHINPVTGMPGVCHAQAGRCPFGGVNEHYNSYEEAQEKSDEIASERFQNYEQSEMKIRETINWNDLSDYSKINSIDPDEAIKIIKDTSDVNLLSDVISRKVLNSSDDDTRYIDAALVNDNVSEDTLYDIVDNPQSYTEHTLSVVANNPELTSDERVSLMKGAPNDSSFCQQIAENPGIKGMAIREILTDLRTNNNEDWPKNTAMLLYNKNCPKDTFDEWTLPQPNGKPSLMRQFLSA